jgi:hypothetical protein
VNGLHVRRSGLYLRVCDPEWTDCTDTSYSKTVGGRWNERGRFGVLYLCRDLTVAAANARKNFEGEIHSLYDLKPEFRPVLMEFSLGRSPGRRFIDAVSTAGLAALGLPASYPRTEHGAMVPRARCRTVGARAYAAGEAGIACRSAAEAARAAWIGEELALFDRASGQAVPGNRRAFADWYPQAT